MAKSWRLVVCVASFVGGASVGCGAPERGDDPTARAGDQTTEKRSGAVTTSLFQPYVAYPTGSFPEAVAIGDLDGDGRNDVALLTALFSDPDNDKMVHVFLQDTDGSLKPRVKYAVGGRGTSMDIGDINGDGRADVVVGFYDATNWIAVLLQNAAGTLDPMVAYPTPNAGQVKIGDFNGDGRLDVASLSSGTDGSGLNVFLQNETGGLAPPVTYAVPHAGFGELDAADVDGDGRTDVVVVSLPDVSFLLQTPDGVLGAPTSYSLSGNVNASGVAVGDANGDGRTDIVVSYGGSRPNSFIGRFLQNAGGTLDPAVSYASYDNPSAIVLADVDADGRRDALVTHDGMVRLGVYRQSPSGNFGAEELYAIPYASQYQPQGLAVGDINGDGRPDAVIADYNNGLVVLRHVNDSLSVAISSPAPGSFSYVGMPLTIGWTVGDAAAVAGFDLSMSLNSGISYMPIAGCTGLPATARACSWTPMSAFSALVRVTARDDASNTAFSEATVSVVTPSIRMLGPVSTQYVGSLTTVSWSHNLQASGTVRIELSRDGGVSYETLADAAPISTSGGSAGSFPWTPAGPPTSTALVRVTANGPVAASASTVKFSIIAPTVTITVPAAGATAYTTSSLSVAWATNVSGVDTVRIELSRDGGATFQTITASAPNTGTFSGFLPSGPASTNAVVRVTTNGPVIAAGTSASFTLVQPTAAVTSPEAGAVTYAGAPLAITWSTNLPATYLVTVELSRDGGSTYGIVASRAPNTGSFVWIVTGPSTGTARVRVTISGAGFAFAMSGTFAISVPVVTVTGPAAGAAFYAGAPLTITWSTNLPASSPAVIEVSRDGGGTFEIVAAAAPNTGSFNWVVTGPDSAAVVARVTVTDPVPASGTSGAFAIATPALAITGPAGGTLAYAGTPVTITWTDNLPDVDPMTIELSRDAGATFELLEAAAANTGSFVWPASGPDTAEARVRVTSSGAVVVSDLGPAFQIVNGSVTVSSPAAGDNWAVGTERTISWSSNLPADATVAVELSRDGGGSWETLASGQAASGGVTWTATAPEASAAIVRVSAEGSVPAIGTSGVFAIGSAAVAVTSPAAGASWTIGTAQTIAWTSNLLPSGTVKIQVSRNGGTTYTAIASAAPNTGSFAWTPAGSASSNAIVRVSPNGFAASNLSGTFSLVAASIRVTSPNTVVTWAIGSVQTITWTHNLDADAQFMIEVSRSGVWSTITPAVPGGGATSGSYEWTVTGPATSNAKIRVTWTGGTTKDSSDVSFRIH